MSDEMAIRAIVREEIAAAMNAREISNPGERAVMIYLADRDDGRGLIKMLERLSKTQTAEDQVEATRRVASVNIWFVLLVAVLSPLLAGAVGWAAWKLAQPTPPEISAPKR